MDADTQKALDRWVESDGWKFTHMCQPENLDALCGYDPGGARTRDPDHVDCPKCLSLMCYGIIELDVLAMKER